MNPEQLITAVPLFAALVAGLVVLLREINKGNKSCDEALKSIGERLDGIDSRISGLEISTAYNRGRDEEAGRSGGYNAIIPRPPRKPKV